MPSVVTRRLGAIIAVGILALGGSAPLDGAAPVPPALARRVTAFMKAWQGQDLSAMYPFYCAAYRQKTPQSEYLKLVRLVRYPILEFRVTGAEMEGAKASVTVWRKTDATASPIGVFEGESQQVWLRSPAGTWCKEDEPLLLPFPGGSR